MMQEGSKTIIEGLSNSRKKRPLFDLIVLRAGYNQDLHDAILKGDQKFLDKYIKNYPDKEELSWYTDEPIKITKKMKDEVKIQDEEITRSLKESNSIDEMKDTDKTNELWCEIYKEGVSESQRVIIEACVNESDDYKIVKKREHYEVYKNNKLILSADTREEAEKEIHELENGDESTVINKSMSRIIEGLQSTNSGSKLVIQVESGINADGFTVSIIRDDKVIFSESYMYGYNASWSRSHAKQAEEDHEKAIKYKWDNAGYYTLKPYPTDIIKELMKKYKIDKSNVIVTAGKNVFAGKPVSDKNVKDFYKDYLSELGIKEVSEGLVYNNNSKGPIKSKKYKLQQDFCYGDLSSVISCIENKKDLDEFTSKARASIESGNTIFYIPKGTIIECLDNVPDYGGAYTFKVFGVKIPIACFSSKFNGKEVYWSDDEIEKWVKEA